MKTVDYKNRLWTGKMPIREKKLQKKGTLRVGICESTPIVWKGELLMAEWTRPADMSTIGLSNAVGYIRFLNLKNGEQVGEPCGENRSFMCAIAEGDTMYVICTRRFPDDESQDHIIDIYSSSDLVHWEEHLAVITLPAPLKKAFNTSVCKDADGFTMIIETNAPREISGGGFMAVFAKSTDMIHWELLPFDRFVFCNDADHSAGNPTIRYLDGYYYIIYNDRIMSWWRFMPYIVRTPDLETYEPGLYNPMFMPDDDDKLMPFPERFTEEERAYIETAVDTNNSDSDLCEYEGKTILTYNWGNQRASGNFIAYAEYDGGLEEFLKSWF